MPNVSLLQYHSNEPVVGLEVTGEYSNLLSCEQSLCESLGWIDSICGTIVYVLCTRLTFCRCHIFLFLFFFEFVALRCIRLVGLAKGGGARFFCVIVGFKSCHVFGQVIRSLTNFNNMWCFDRHMLSLHLGRLVPWSRLLGYRFYIMVFQKVSKTYLIQDSSLESQIA